MHKLSVISFNTVNSPSICQKNIYDLLYLISLHILLSDNAKV